MCTIYENNNMIKMQSMIHMGKYKTETMIDKCLDINIAGLSTFRVYTYIL